jgi:hypothetical protein
MLGKMSKEITLDGVIAELNSAVQNVDAFAQAATKDTEDQILRARLTQALVLAGTAVEILGGLNAQAKAAAQAMANQQDKDVAVNEDSADV